MSAAGRLQAAFGVALVVLAVATAHADNKPRAREAYARATQHYELGEYREALEEFKTAYRYFPDPAFLYNIAQCHRQIGESAQAIKQYRMYLIKVPDAPNANEVRQLIASLEHPAASEPSAAKPSPTTEPSKPTPAPDLTPATPASFRARQPTPARHRWSNTPHRSPCSSGFPIRPCSGSRFSSPLRSGQ